MKEFKGVWVPYEIITDIKLNNKEKMVYSMILYLSKEKECIMSNSYISELLNITKIQSSRIINSLKKKGYIKVEMTYRENSKEIPLRKIIPIYKNVNTYKQVDMKPINTNVKEIKNNHKNMLETIFEAREEDLAFITDEYKKFMSQDKANKIKKSDCLKKELEKIPYNLNWLKDSIEKLIKDYVETIDFESYYFHRNIISQD